MDLKLIVLVVVAVLALNLLIQLLPAIVTFLALYGAWHLYQQYTHKPPR